jgi:hypothetical protein
MMQKVLTSDCPSCNLCIINDENKFQCLWGKSKKIKILETGKGRPKKCQLTRN